MSKKDSLSQHLVDYARQVAGMVKGANTTYSHADQNGTHGQPKVDLNADQPNVSTDCSGWLRYSMESVAPLHDAVLQAQKNIALFNQDNTAYDPAENGMVELPFAESGKAWARADVVQNFFSSLRTGGTAGTGFDPVGGIRSVKAGDVIAYALGADAAPQPWGSATDTSLTMPSDTGHVMIADGTAKEIWSRSDPDGGKVADATIAPGLAQSATAVYSVNVIDSSDLRHNCDQNLNKTSDDGNETRDGLGEGRIWFATDAQGNVVQARFYEGDPWFPDQTPGPSADGSAVDPQKFALSIGRMTSAIDLTRVAGPDGRLEVNVGANAQAVLPKKDGGDRDYAGEETLTGRGGLLVDGGGTLRLSGSNTFGAGAALGDAPTVLVQDQGTTVSLASNSGLGDGANTLGLGAGTELKFTGDVAFTHAIQFSGEATIHASSGTTDALRGPISYTGSGAASLRIAGPGDLSLSADIAGTASTTFVFSKDHGNDVVDDFTALGAHHDTLSLSKSDFADLAAVLSHTADTAAGVQITDPSTQATITLTGVSKGDLQHHPGDIRLH